MKKARLAAILLALILIVSACANKSNGGTTPGTTTPGETSPGSAAPGGSGGAGDPVTVTIGINFQFSNMDLLEGGHSTALNLLYEGLFKTNPYTGEVEKQLVREWEYLDDLTIKLELRDDVYFQCGRHLTSEDVLYSLTDMAGSTFGQYYSAYDLENSKAEGDFTVIIKTFESFGPGIVNFARAGDIHCSVHYPTFTPADIWDHHCGTGPYTLVENVSGSHTTLKLREDYWNKSAMPEVDTFILRSYSEVSTMFIDFENGALDMVFSLDDSSYRRLLAGEVAGATVKAPSIYNMYNLILPEYVEYFKDIRVREAITIAIDWTVVGEIGMGALASLPTSNLPVSMYPFYKYQGAYEFNPERAKKLLAEAGYPDGGIVLNVVATIDPAELRIYESMQAYLADIGIELKFEAFDPSTAMPRIASGDTDMWIMVPRGAAPIAEPTLTLSDGHAHAGAFLAPTRITDPVYNSYWDAGKFSLDLNKRIEAYGKVQEWLHNNYRHIPIMEVVNPFAYYDKVVADFNSYEVYGPNLRWVKLA